MDKYKIENERLEEEKEGLGERVQELEILVRKREEEI